MIIIGVDFHPEFQQIAWVDTDTGEFQEKRLAHPDEAEKFYRALAGEKVRVGMEASGHARWFERLVSELQFELRIGDAAEIRTKRVRKQKTDRQDAQLILRLLLEDRFPQIWVPSSENRDLRQLLWHRHRMVQARTRIMNQLQAVALNEGLRCKKKLWRERGRQQLESFRLAPWASRRRRDLLELMDRLNPTLAELTVQEISSIMQRSPSSIRSMLHRLGESTQRGRDWFTVYSLAGALHIRSDEVQRWIDHGWLKCRVVETAGVKKRIIDPDDFSEFVKRYGPTVVGRRLAVDGLWFVKNFVFRPKHAHLLPLRKSKNIRAEKDDCDGDRQIG
jgi:hypothetical protein